MTPKQIKIEMIKKDVTGPYLASVLQCRPQAIYRVRDGKSTSRRIQGAIAQAIEMPVEKLFPSKKKAA